MDQAIGCLIAASALFVGTHFALSHPLRAPLVRAVGGAAFQGLYSLVALASLAWVVFAFRAADPGVPAWNGQSDLAWALATLIMLVASVLLVGSFLGNPALPAPGAAELAAKGPHGVFYVTRHPMMWSFAQWSAAHVLVSPTPRVMVLSFAIGFLALVGARLQDGKKQSLMHEAWTGWEAKTSYWPQFGNLTKAGAVPWLGGVALWLTATWAHGWLIGIAAGAWRWI